MKQQTVTTPRILKGHVRDSGHQAYHLQALLHQQLCFGFKNVTILYSSDGVMSIYFHFGRLLIL